MEVLTAPAVTANVADVAPCGTVTLAGTFAPVGDELKVIVAPPLGAADDSDTVQVDPVDGVREAGLQVKALRAAGCRIVTVPPLVAVVIAAPVASALTPLTSWTDEDALVVDGDKLNVTVATTALVTVVSLRPQTTHVVVPVPLLQDSDLFAAPGPATKLADAKSVVE